MVPIANLHSSVWNRATTQVLVVDDDICVGAAIRTLLNIEGCSTVHVQDSDTGSKLFESMRFDVAIVDIFMPGRSGIETIASFRAQAPQVPIIAMSGFRFRSGSDRNLDFLGMAIAAGAATGLRKPFTLHQLMAALHESINPAVGCSQSPRRRVKQEGAM